MRDDPRVRRAVAGVMRFMSAEIPAPFMVRPSMRVVSEGIPVFSPTVVVAGASAMRSDTIDVTRVGTMIEIGTGGRLRLPTRRAYESAGVVCVWRIEVDLHPGYRGPLPVIFVRTRFGDRWRERFSLRGVEHTLPLCVGRARNGDPQWISVTLDPAWLGC